MERKPNLSLKECKMAILEERRVDYIASTSGDPDQTQHADQNGDHDAPQNGEQNGHHYSSSNPGSDPTLGSSNAFYGLDNETQTPPNPNPNLSQPENLSQSSSSTATIHSSVLPPLQNQHPPPSRSSSPSLTLNRPSSQIVSNETSQVQTSTTAYNSHSVILLDLTHILSLYTAVQQGLDPIQGLNQGLDEGEVQQQVPFTAFKLHPEDLECVPESMLPYSNNTSSPSNPLWDTVDDNHPPHIFPRNSNSDIGRTRSHNQSNELQRNNYMNDSLVSDVSYPANTDSFGVENPLWNNSSSQNQYSQRDFRNQNRACINTVSTSNTSQYQIPTISTPIFNVYSQPFTLTLQPTDDTVNFHLTYLGSVPFPKMDITLTLSNQPPTLDSYEFDNKFNKARSAFNHITIEELRVLIESENFSKSEKQILRIELSLQPHPPKPKYAGLKNQGATCYISSLIQMLYHLKFFRKQVFEKCLLANNSVLKGLGLTFYKLARTESADTMALTTAFGWGIAEGFVQHDLHELNRILLDKLEKVMNLEWWEFKDVMRIKCTDVDYGSKRVEGASDLGLDVEGCESLEASLEKFVEKEQMDGDNKYDAGPLHGKQDAEMWHSLYSPPKVLLIHLKRFAFDYNTMSRSKVTSNMEFPVEIDLQPYCDDSAGNSEKFYHLYSVVIHKGSVESGHYFTYIRPKPESYKPNYTGAEWFQFNDEDVRSCWEEEVLRVGKTGAYMLCYIAEDAIEEVLGTSSENENGGGGEEEEELPPNWDAFYQNEMQSIKKKRKAQQQPPPPLDTNLVFFNDSDINAHFKDLSIATTTRDGELWGGEVSLDFFKQKPPHKLKGGLNAYEILLLASTTLQLPVKNIVVWCCKIHEGLKKDEPTNVVARVVRVDRVICSGCLQELFPEEEGNFMNYTIDRLVQKTSRFFYVDVMDDELTTQPKSLFTDPPLFGFVTNKVYSPPKSPPPKEEKEEPSDSDSDSGSYNFRAWYATAHNEAEDDPQSFFDRCCEVPFPQKLYFFISLVETGANQFGFELVGKCVLNQETPLRCGQVEAIVADVGGPTGAWIYGYDHYSHDKEKNLQPVAITPRKKSRAVEEEVAQVIIFQDPVPGFPTMFTGNSKKDTEMGRNVRCLICEGSKRTTFKALPVTWSDGEGKPTTVLLNRDYTIAEAEESLNGILGSDVKLFTALEHAGKLAPKLHIGFSVTQALSDLFGKEGAFFYAEQVKGVKVAMWNDQGLTIENVDVDQWMSAEDIKSKLPQSNLWRLLYLRENELVETVRPKESLQAYSSHFEDNRAHHCPQAKISMLDSGALEYNFEGRKGAVEGVVFVAEPIERVAVEEEEGTSPSVVPVVIEIGAEDNGSWKRVGVPILTYIRKEVDTGKVLGERIVQRTGLQFDTMWVLGDQAGTKGGNHVWDDGEVGMDPVNECTLLWTYLKSESSVYRSFGRGAGSETLGILGMKALPHGMTPVDYDKIPRVGFHLSESALVDFRASRAKFMQSEGVNFDEKGEPLLGKDRGIKKRKTGIDIRDRSGSI